MKTLILPALLLSTSAFAQPPRPAHAPEPPRAREELLAELNLTDAQQRELEIIYADARVAREALHADIEQQVEAVLTPEQFSAWQQARPKAPPAPPRPQRGGPQS